LKNGAIIGAVAGAAYFVTLAALLGDTDGGEVIVSTAIAGVVLFAGMGAAAGAGTDALITHQQVIYRKAGGKNRVSVSPLFGRRHQGAAITVKF
jgi:O-antigen/teichoic acid export membrane protein